jgi:hypothetical protein
MRLLSGTRFRYMLAAIGTLLTEACTAFQQRCDAVLVLPQHPRPTLLPPQIGATEISLT